MPEAYNMSSLRRIGCFTTVFHTTVAFTWMETTRSACIWNVAFFVSHFSVLLSLDFIPRIEWFLQPRQPLHFFTKIWGLSDESYKEVWETVVEMCADEQAARPLLQWNANSYLAFCGLWTYHGWTCKSVAWSDYLAALEGLFKKNIVFTVHTGFHRLLRSLPFTSAITVYNGHHRLHVITVFYSWFHVYVYTHGLHGITRRHFLRLYGCEKCAWSLMFCKFSRIQREP